MSTVVYSSKEEARLLQQETARRGEKVKAASIVAKIQSAAATGIPLTG